MSAAAIVLTVAISLGVFGLTLLGVLGWISEHTHPELASSDAAIHAHGLCGIVVNLQDLGDYPCVRVDDGEPGVHDGDCVTEPELDGTWPPR